MNEISISNHSPGLVGLIPIPCLILAHEFTQQSTFCALSHAYFIRCIYDYSAKQKFTYIHLHVRCIDTWLTKGTSIIRKRILGSDACHFRNFHINNLATVVYDWCVKRIRMTDTPN